MSGRCEAPFAACAHCNWLSSAPPTAVLVRVEAKARAAQTPASQEETAGGMLAVVEPVRVRLAVAVTQRAGTQATALPETQRRAVPAMPAVRLATRAAVAREEARGLRAAAIRSPPPPGPTC
jgi:hypothetical protein